MTDEEDKESDITINTAAEVETDIEEPAPAVGVGDESAAATATRGRVSLSVRSLVVGVVIAALVVGLGVLGWLYLGARDDLSAKVRQTDDSAHAEQVALNYAVNAAAMNAQDLGAWKEKLVAGTSPELKDKLSKAADQMEQVLVPLQWNSSAQPLAAKVRSSNGGVFVVDSFVSVLTKTAQGPDPLQSTATYSVTVDSGKDWQITDVGGIGSVTQGK